MEKPRLILHIGSQKTGTTSIQGFLKNKADALAAEGVNYVSAGRTNIAHNSVLQAINQNGGKKVAKAMVAEIKAAPDVTHVISSEMFFRRGLAPWFDTHFPRRIKRQTKVIAYSRRQDKYAEAMYKQRVKNGRYQGDPEDFAREQIDLYYGRVLRQFSQVFGQENIIVRPFERRNFPNGDVQQDFAHILGLSRELAEGYDLPSSNATLSREVSEQLGDMRRAGTDINTRDIIRKIIAIKPQGAIRSGDCLSLALRREIMAHHAKFNENIRATYCPDIEQLFDEKDLEDDAAYELPTSLETAIRTEQAKHAIDLAIDQLSA